MKKSNNLWDNYNFSIFETIKSPTHETNSKFFEISFAAELMTKNEAGSFGDSFFMWISVKQNSCFFCDFNASEFEFRIAISDFAEQLVLLN